MSISIERVSCFKYHISRVSVFRVSTLRNCFNQGRNITAWNSYIQVRSKLCYYVVLGGRKLCSASHYHLQIYKYFCVYLHLKLQRRGMNGRGEILAKSDNVGSRLYISVDGSRSNFHLFDFCSWQNRRWGTKSIKRDLSKIACSPL